MSNDTDIKSTDQPAQSTNVVDNPSGSALVLKPPALPPMMWESDDSDNWTAIASLFGLAEPATLPITSTPQWRQMSVGLLKWIDVGSDGTVWGINTNDQIFRKDREQWTNIPGLLKQIAVGNASQVWGVNASDQIYQWIGSTWKDIAGSLKCVSVSADGSVWGVNASDQIFRRDGEQ